jgi:hypothetical protein
MHSGQLATLATRNTPPINWGKAIEVTAWVGLASICLVQALGSPEVILAHASRCLQGQSSSFEGAVLLGHCGWCWGGLTAAVFAAVAIVRDSRTGQSD